MDKLYSSDMPPLMILCGGQGTRLRDVTELLPKPMVPIGSQPILWHIMKGYAAFGVKRFILCLGYKRESFIDYFLNFRARASDITVSLGGLNDIVYHGSSHEDDWVVTLADTGDSTMTGGRIARAAKYLTAEDNDFFLTYGDAVADVNIAELLRFHRSHQRMISLTAIQPSGRFGEIRFDGDMVDGFTEKPIRDKGYINGGFMVLKKEAVSRYIPNCDDAVFEQEPIQTAVQEQQMMAFKHDGFWQCMDTPREHKLLTDMWNGGRAEWTKYW